MESGSFREWNCAFGWILLFSTILSICSSQDYDTLKPSKIYKCCPENKYFDLTTKSCKNADESILDDTKVQRECPLDEADLIENCYIGDKLVSCNETTHELTYYYEFIENYIIDGGNLFLTQEYLVFKEDYICIDRGYKERYINIDEHIDFKDSINPGITFESDVAVVCRPKEELDCAKRPCLNFCCKFDEVYDPIMRACIQSQDSALFDGALFDPDEQKVMNLTEIQRFWNTTEERPVRIFFDRLEALGRCLTDSYTINEEAWILKTTEASVGGSLYNYTKYCVVTEPPNPAENENVTHKILICQSQAFNEFNEVFSFIVIPILSLISAASLVCLFIHLWIEDRSKLFGSMILCMIATLIPFYILLSAIKLGGGSLVKMKTACTIIGFLSQFTNLSAFFWLNALSFEIWMKFRRIQNPKVGAPIHMKQIMGCTNSRFKWYALYSWTVPFMIVCVTLILQFLPKTHTKGLILPEIAKNSCYFGNQLSFLFYLYIILAPVLAANLFFFLSFIYNLVFGIWSKSSDMIDRQRHHSNLKIVSKIFFIMGITWVAEIVSFFVSWTYGNFATYKYVSVFDVINSLQGFFFTVIMIFDTKRVKLIRSKFVQKNKKDREPSSDQTNSTYQPS